MTGWIVVFGALVAELIGGIVTNAMSAAIATAVLAFPAAVAAGFAVAQWLQVRSCRAEPANWWHLVGIGAALIIWLAYPTTPGVLYGIDNAPQACNILLARPTPPPACLARATQALDSSNLAWWLTGALILAVALLARRSRIAAWTAVPVALGGCLLATHFLELLILHYQPGG